tara:strand:+ start:2014 stop:2415 length:402 start_codon:yes stop_codon:yes gene_type:complete
MKPVTKAKIMFCLFDDAIAMQVNYVDKRFICYGKMKSYTAFNGNELVSFDKPKFFYNALYLWGLYNYDATSIYTRIGSNQEKVLKGHILALKDWAKNWPGFNGEVPITPKITDDFGNDIDLETYNGRFINLEV